MYDFSLQEESSFVHISLCSGGIIAGGFVATARSVFAAEFSRVQNQEGCHSHIDRSSSKGARSVNRLNSEERESINFSQLLRCFCK